MRSGRISNIRDIVHSGDQLIPVAGPGQDNVHD